MIINMKIVMFGVALLFSTMAFRQYATAPRSGPAFVDDAKLNFPEHYREWVYLSSGFDMSYNSTMQMDQHIFDNVFVNP